MKIEFSKHALARMKSKGISKENVLNTVEHADSILKQDESTTVYSKIVEEDSKSYLYRVFVNKTKEPAMIITAYKTSKIEKYGY